MSEYQYYEFQAVDRPLTDKETEELRALSTRAEITRTSFTNVYNFGDFRGNPDKVLDKYFDAFLYVANWGTHRFMLRLPRSLVDVGVLSEYEVKNVLSVRAGPKHVVLDFNSNLEEGGDWESGEEWMSDLLPIRSELLAGDLRPLYLGWLSSLEHGFAHVADDTIEPAVPPGLGKLPASLERLAEFLRISPELVQAAAEGSPPGGPAGPTREDLVRWISGLPETEKNELLAGMLDDEPRFIKMELLRRYRASLPASPAIASGPRRTVGRLRERVVDPERLREEEETRRKAKERARQEKQKAVEQGRRLDALAARGDSVWAQLETMIASRKPKEYDQAVELLKDLRALAERDSQQARFEARLRELRERHSRLWSFRQRLDRAGLQPS